jgi:hypothetical protein
MSEAKDATPKWIDDDAEALFATLGKYWIIFQWIEGKLDMLMLLAWGHENWNASQTKLARMTNAQKIDSVASIVLTTPGFARVHTRPDWVSHFKSVIAALHTERKRRNSMTHSQILFEFADKGLGPPLMSTRMKASGGDEPFERHWLSKDFQQKMLAEIGELAMQVNFFYVQLIHDYQAAHPEQDQRLEQ